MLNLSTPRNTNEIKPRITVIGVGGAGGNAVNNMIRSNLEGVEFVVANTDAQALAQSICDRRIQLGLNITQGLGAGARPDVGRAAAEEALGDHRLGTARRQHGVHHRRHGRRHRHGRGAGHRPRGARARHPDRRRGDQAVPLRGHAPHAPGRERHHGAAAIRRHADHHPEPEPVPRRQREARPSPTPSRWPTRCCTPACAASPT